MITFSLTLIFNLQVTFVYIISFCSDHNPGNKAEKEPLFVNLERIITYFKDKSSQWKSTNGSVSFNNLPMSCSLSLDAS